MLIQPKYNNADQYPVVFNLVKKYITEYRNMYNADEPVERNDLHHQW